MRITPHLLAVAAVGDGTVTLDGQVPPELAGVVAGGACVLSDDEIAYQRRIGPEQYIIEAFSLSGRSRRLLANRGANLLRADGQGRFATWTPAAGVVDEAGRTWPKARLLDYDNGVLVLCPNQQTGLGIELWSDGQKLETIANTGPLFTDAVTGPAVLLRSGVLAYQNDRGWTVIGGARPYARPSYAVAMVPVPLPDGKVIVLEHDETRLYLRHSDDLQNGFLISDSGEHHAIDARLDGDDLFVAWWRGPACLPGECRTAIVKVADIGTMPLPKAAAVTALATNVPSFQIGGMWAANDSAPGNLAIGSRTYTAPRHTCVIAGDQFIESIPKERRLGLLVYLAGDDATITAELKRNIAIADAGQYVMFIYDDRRQGRFDLVKNLCGDRRWVWMPLWYLMPGETPAAFASEVVALATAHGGHPMLPVIRAYCSVNGEGVDVIPESLVIEALNALITQNALRLPGVLGPMFFAWDRLDGALNRPAVKAAVEQWLKTPLTVTDAEAWAADFLGPDQPEVPVSNVPDYSADLEALYNTGAFRLDSHDGCGIFTDAAARLLRAKDSEIGHLIKRPGQNQYPDENGHAVDAILHQSSGCSIDIISKSETPEARPGWGVDIPRYSATDWRDPGPQPRSAIQRPDLPFVLGMSAFDFCTLAQDLADLWLDLHIQYKLPYLRLIPQSVFRTPRTLEQGLAQLDAALPRIAAKGLGALVSLNCDTKEYGMKRADVIANTKAMNAILLTHADKFGPLMLIPDLGNEVQNGNEQPFMMDPFFLLELDGLIDPRFPLGWAPMFGTDIAPAASGGSWIPHHSDRGLSPDENGRIMAAAQARYGKKVMDRESTGFAEPGTQGQRTWDVEFARSLGENAKRHQLGGLFYHTQAGLRANANEFGPSHRAGAVALLEGLGGAVVVPPPPPVEVSAFVTLRNEAIASAINIAYDTLLGRKPDPIGWNIYQGRLREGWSVTQMEDDIRSSAEYKAKHGG